MSTFLGPCMGVQQKSASAGVIGVSGCGDIANAVAWINANFSSVSPLSLAWANNPSGWQYNWSGSFDTPSDTTPDPDGISTYSGLIPGGSEYTTASYYAVGDGGGSAVRVAFLLPDPTAQIVGVWCSDAECAILWQQSCVMTGVAGPSCGVSQTRYVFDIPIPDSSLCNTEYPYSPGYLIYPNSTYGGLFEDNLWSAFVTACEASPATCAASTSPGPCLSGDPFFGDPPP